MKRDGVPRSLGARPYRYRPEYVRLSLVGRVTPCAPPRVIRI